MARPPAASAAPFLKTLRSARPAGNSDAESSERAREPAKSARPVASVDDAEAEMMPDLPPADESFESATTVVPRSVLAHRDVDRGDSVPITSLKPPPALEDVVARIPAETRDALEQLFRARFRAVRRITPEQLR